jgi:predicted branched-subunit amino acid permease
VHRLSASAIDRDAIAIGVAVGAYGLSFGAIAVSSGLSVGQSVVLSAGMFTGASQFAMVGVLGAGGGAAVAVASAFLLGLRNTAYALRMRQLLVPQGLTRLAAAQLTIDESTAMALGHAPNSPQAARRAFWATGISVFVCWNLATLAGALAAGAIADPAAWGLDAAVPAGFLALLWPQVRSRPAAAAAALGAVLALLLTPIAPPGVPVLLAGVAAIALAAAMPDAERP